MRTWSRLLREHRRLAAVLVALALCMKVLVPAGYMIGASSKLITIQVCTDASGGELTRQITIPPNIGAGGQTEQGPAHGKVEATCAWTALAQASLGGADLGLLGLALAFILALGVAWQTPQPRRTFHHIRPPLRGPPLSA